VGQIRNDYLVLYPNQRDTALANKERKRENSQVVEYFIFYIDCRIHAYGRDQPGERQNSHAACA
jgi:hypothetical protein